MSRFTENFQLFNSSYMLSSQQVSLFSNPKCLPDHEYINPNSVHVYSLLEHMYGCYMHTRTHTNTPVLAHSFINTPRATMKPRNYAFSEIFGIFEIFSQLHVKVHMQT